MNLEGEQIQVYPYRVTSFEAVQRKIWSKDKKTILCYTGKNGGLKRVWI